MNKNKDIKIIILASSRDFKGCSLSFEHASCLWPVFGVSALERLLVSLAGQGVSKAVVCSNGCGQDIAQSINQSICPELEFLDEPFPVGSAGCIKMATSDQEDSLLLVIQGNLVSPPDLDELVSLHNQGGGEMTVMFDSSSGNENSQQNLAGIYVCSPEVLDFIPQAGYFDIKEGLMPALLQSGKKVCYATLAKPAGNFRDRYEYIRSLASRLQDSGIEGFGDIGLTAYNDLPEVWVASGVKIDPKAKLCGPVVVLDGAVIEKDAVILGPSVIGRNAIIGNNSVIVNSILWDGPRVGSDCQVYECVIANDAVVNDNEIIENESVVIRQGNLLGKFMRTAIASIKKRVNELNSKITTKVEPISNQLSGLSGSGNKPATYTLLGLLLFVAFLWSYWSGLKDVWRMWMTSDEFSSGLLVPFLAVYILWSRRHALAQIPIKPAMWCGALGFLFAQLVRLSGTFFMYGSLERFSIILSLSSLVLLVLGWKFFRKVFSILLFLFLMLPWPNQVQAAVTLPLQRWATSSAVFCLELVGYDIIQDGNVIHLGDTSVAVAEACNGLRMITAFFVIIGLVVLIAERTKWEKIIVFVSCLPIALICNTIRLVVTSIAFTFLKGEQWETMFHDFGGYAMMPLALAIAVAEFWLLKKLTTPPEEIKETVVVKNKAEHKKS